MQCNTGWGKGQGAWLAVAHGVALVGVVVLAVLGQPLESSQGWLVCGGEGVRTAVPRRQGRRCAACGGLAWRAGVAWLRQSWWVAAVRSVGLLLLAFLSERWPWHGLCLLPWGVWLCQGLAVGWPRLGRQGWYRALRRGLELLSALALVGLALVWLAQRVALAGEGQWLPGLSLGCVAYTPSVAVTQDEHGGYHVRLRGEFELHVDGQVPFYQRMLILFLGQLEVPGQRRGSRRTREARTPFVRQQQLAAWFGVTQPEISRWRRYWLTQDWRRLLSQRGGDLLTMELQRRVLHTWAQFPWWGATRLWEHLHDQGECISRYQVQQVARESGWADLHQRLTQVYTITAESFRPQDEWLVGQLLAQVHTLLARLEELEALPPQQRVALHDLTALSQELGLQPAPARTPLPWTLRLEQVLFGHWQLVEDASVCCLYCGSRDVSRKSRTGRLKTYLDEHGQEQTVEVLRYYCHNPACAYRSFTNLPPGLLPYSRQPLRQRLGALQGYVWGRSVYRRCAQSLGVSRTTAYRWVSRFGADLLPVAALFGVVRCSGAVGVDEKYVRVPKNDKPHTPLSRWMYVYLAVDCYTYDLLHIELYPYNNAHSAHAFLLALRAKGYRPRVLVTDLRADYGPLIAQVFPKAVHHECIFHALQQVHRHIKASYGADYAHTHPAVVTLQHDIDRIFAARTKRTAQRRYQAVLAQREAFVAHTPAAVCIFDFLEHHWPKLVNAIESRRIPTTNNTTEQVVRIFNQHYKTRCGLERIDTARRYLAVFEKVYRFTPFSDDAQARLRGKCPLALAGYAVDELPFAQLFRGLALHWPASAFQELVPNV